ncbi:MAG: AAA family ATPase [bacterium]|nr:AAA family ATPase [bacterium]
MSQFEEKIMNDAIDAVEKKDKKVEFLIGAPKSWVDITEEENKREWIWENYIAKGHITLLSALWKAGKSTLLRHLFVAISREEEFGGQPTTKSRVLIISEENEGEWLSQREELDEDEVSHIFIWSRPIRVKPNLKQWIQFVTQITDYSIENNIDLIVIDTLSTFWPIDNENDSAQVLKALVPLYALTEKKLGVLLVHHFRKGGGDQAQASRGSGALPGFVDNIIEFTRNENGMPTQRVLKTYGRFDAVIPTIVIELNSQGKYETKGEPWQVSKSARLQKIMDIFTDERTDERTGERTDESLSLSTKQIFNRWTADGPDITLRSIQNYVKELVFKNYLSSVDSRLEGKRKIEIYAQTGNYAELTKIDLSLPMTPFVTSPNKTRSTDENGSESLSSVNPQIVPPADETKGTSPIDFDKGWDPRI